MTNEWGEGGGGRSVRGSVNLTRNPKNERVSRSAQGGGALGLEDAVTSSLLCGISYSPVRKDVGKHTELNDGPKIMSAKGRMCVRAPVF